MSDFVDIVFDGPCGAESGRFVEVEDDQGKSVRIGYWVQREDGRHVLRIPALCHLTKTLEEIAEILDLESIDWGLDEKGLKRLVEEVSYQKRSS